MNLLKKSSSIDLRSSRTSLSSRCSPQAGSSILTSRTIEEEGSPKTEVTVQHEGRVHAYFAPVTKFNKNKPSYAVLRKERVLEIYESEKARFKAKQELENFVETGKKQKGSKQPIIIDLSRCFNVSKEQFNKEMGFNCVALMTPDQTLFLKNDADDKEQTERWFTELRQTTKTARALQLGRHVNEKEFFERAFDVQLVRNPKLEKKFRNTGSVDRYKNICEHDASLEGYWRFCIYPHTVILCKRGIEPPKEENRIPESHVPPFDKDDFIELPRNLIVRKLPLGKFYYMQIGHGFPKYGCCEIYMATESTDTAFYIDAQYEEISRKYQERQQRGMQYPSLDYDDDAPSERRTSNSSGRSHGHGHGHQRRTHKGETSKKMPDSSLIALSNSRNTHVPISSSTVATAAKAARAIEKSRRAHGGAMTPETQRKASVTRPMSFGIGSPLGISSYLQQQPRAHSISEQGAPLTPSGQVAQMRKYSQALLQSEEVNSTDGIYRMARTTQANKRASRLAQTDNCPVKMHFSSGEAGEETEDSGGTLCAFERSPRMRRKDSPPYIQADEVVPEVVDAPRPCFEYNNIVVHENAALPIMNDLNSFHGGLNNDDEYEQFDAAESAKAFTMEKVTTWILQKNRRSQRPDSTSTNNDDEIASLTSSFAHTNTDGSDVDMSDGGGNEGVKDAHQMEYTMMEPMAVDRVSCSSGSNTHLSVPQYAQTHEDDHSCSETSSDLGYGSVQPRAFSFSCRQSIANYSTNGTTGTTSMSSSSRQFTDDEQSSPGATVHQRRANPSAPKSGAVPPHDYPINHLGIKDQMRTALSPELLTATDDAEERNRSYSLGSRKYFWQKPLTKLFKAQSNSSRQNSSFSSIASHTHSHGDSSGGCSMNSSNSALHPPKNSLLGGRRKTTSGNSHHMDIAEGSSVNSSQASLTSHRASGSVGSNRAQFRSKRAGSATERSNDLIEMEFITESSSEAPTMRNGPESVELMSTTSRSRLSSVEHELSFNRLRDNGVFETAAQIHRGAEDEGELVRSPSRQFYKFLSVNEDELRAKLEPSESFLSSSETPVFSKSHPKIDTVPSKNVVGPTTPANGSPHLLMPAASYCSTYSRYGTCCGGGVHFFETIQEAVSGRSSRCDSRCASSLADRSHVLSPPCVMNPSPSIVLVDESASSCRRGSSPRPATATSVSLVNDSRKSSCSSASSCCRRRSTTSVGAIGVGQRRRSSAFDYSSFHSYRKRPSRDSTTSAESAGGMSCCSCGATMVSSKPSNAELSTNQLQVNRPPTPDVVPRIRSKSAVIAIRTPSIKLDSPL